MRGVRWFVAMCASRGSGVVWRVSVSGSPRWSGGRLGRVRRGRPPSRPRGAVGSGAAAVESAADSVVSSSRGRSGALVGWDGCEVRLCVRVPVCVPAPPGVFLPVRASSTLRSLWDFSGVPLRSGLVCEAPRVVLRGYLSTYPSSSARVLLRTTLCLLFSSSPQERWVSFTYHGVQLRHNLINTPGPTRTTQSQTGVVELGAPRRGRWRQ